MYTDSLLAQYFYIYKLSKRMINMKMQSEGYFQYTTHLVVFILVLISFIIMYAY